MDLIFVVFYFIFPIGHSIAINGPVPPSVISPNRPGALPNGHEPPPPVRPVVLSKPAAGGNIRRASIGHQNSISGTESVGSSGVAKGKGRGRKKSNTSDK